MRIILAGLGAVSDAWLKALDASEVVDIAALVEINGEHARAKIGRLDLDAVPLYESLERAVAEAEVDGVIDLTPPHCRLDHARIAFEAGLPTLAEKPLSDSIEPAESLVKLADKHNILYMVAQNYRYGRVIQAAKRVLDSGTLGCVGGMSVQFYKGVELPGFHSTLSDVLLQDMSIHHFDLMRYFLGADPISVFARSYNPPYSWHQGNASVSASIAFANGVMATYDATWAASGRETTWNGNWRFDCELGVLTVVDDQVVLERFAGMADGLLKPTVAESLEAVGQERNQRDYLVQEFYDAGRAGKTPGTPAQDNIRSLRMVFDAIDSSVSGQPIRRQYGDLT